MINLKFNIFKLINVFKIKIIKFLMTEFICNGPFSNLFNLKYSEVTKIGSNNLLYSDGTSNFKKGFYEWYLEDEDNIYSNKLTFTEETEIVTEHYDKIPIVIKANEFDNSGLLINYDTYNITFLKDVKNNYNKCNFSKGIHTIRKLKKKYSSQIIIDDSIVISEIELKHLHQDNEDLFVSLPDVVDNFKRILIYHMQKNSYFYDNILLNALYENVLTDITLTFTDLDKNIVEYNCHSLILSLKSNYYKNLIGSINNFSEGNNRNVTINFTKEMEIDKLDVTKSIIEFLYTNKLLLIIEDDINIMMRYIINLNNLSSYLEINKLNELLSELYNDISKLDLREHLDDYNKLFISHILSLKN